MDLLALFLSIGMVTITVATILLIIRRDKN